MVNPPFFFFDLVYANDLIDSIRHCKVALYADNTVLYTTNKSFDVSVNNLQRDIDSDELHSEAKLLKLKYRREQHVLNFMYGRSNRPDSLVNKSGKGVTTRCQKKKMMKIKKPRTDKFKKSSAYRGPKDWDSLTAYMHQVADKITFKRMLKDWVTQKALKAQQAQQVH